ncbi:RHS repeat-associated core domain-containing protein [Flavobacterium sp. ZB4R12]|uniref:RHS repeat-associated core domain-containing protein n=1 Tax=Flavobacterium sp. ZB4R12 TaxID=3398732 RepID=UPI003AAF8B78
MKKLYFTLIFIVYHLFALAQTPTGSSTEVGITEGQLSVSLTGGANYSIPIAVPPGINGVVPQVGLTYNSQGGNGLAGYGWNISGVSTITRIPATKFHDGKIDAVDFNSMDRFAFDGQRLILKNLTSTYGADGTVYETENFSNVKITSYGIHPSGTNYGPSYFIIEYPDGSKAYYGSTTNSRSITDWAIEYWENPQGVRISYNYILANNNLSIEYIKYGSTTTNAPINQIQFVYKTRQRPEQAYVGGQSFLRNTILSQIKVFGNGQGFRNYLLEHLTQDVTLGYERLSRITESSGDGTKSYNPTIFSYGTTNDVISYDPITTNINVNDISSKNSATVTGDFNGDGKMDFLVYRTTGTTSKSKYWLFYNLDPLVNPNMSYEQNIGAFEEIFASSLLTGDAGAGFKLMPKQGWSIIKNNVSTNTTTFSNYSSEGGMNPVLLQNEKSYQFPLFSWGYPAICGNYSSYVTKTYNVPKKFISGDFNGDGLTDLIAIDKEIYYQSACDRTSLRSGGQSYFVNLDKRLTTNYVTDAGTIIPSTADKYIVADFNGDGKSDLYVFNYQSVRVYALNDLNQFVLLYQNTTADPDVLFERPVLMGDYNGDGKSDFIIPKGYGTNYAKYISTGISFIKTDVTYSIPYIANSGSDCLISNMIIPTDINGDGKTDLITYSTTGCTSTNTGQYWIRVWNNMDSNFANTATFYSGSISGVKQYALPIFLSSDRPNFSMELAAISDNKIYRFSSQKDFNIERLLKTVTTGNGVKESITYSPVVNDPCSYNCNPLYRSSSPIENYPNTDIPVAPSFQVVSKLEKQSATVYKKQLFGYYGAVSNLEGLGFLGFRATMRTNWYDDTTTIISNISKFDVGLRGANTENYSVLYLFSPSSSFAPTDFISKSILGYSSSLTNKVYNIKNTSSLQFNGLDNTNSETTTLYDANNNPTKVTTLLKEGSTLVQTSVGDVTYIPLTTSPYVVGRPSGKIQSITLAATGEITSNEEQYSYTPSLLTQVKKRGNDAGVFITEDNIYDTFGNITKKTITVPAVAPNPAPAPRITNYEYDTSGRFLTKSIDIEGLATTFAYNAYNGLLSSETNPYGLTTTYSYDPWFKKIKTTDYLGKSNTYVYTRSTEKTIVTTTGDDGSGSEETLDDLGRKIKSGVKNLNGTFSYVDYLYDIYDRNYKVSEPYFGTSPTQWSETKYDVYSRISQSISFTGKTVSMSYSGLTTTVNDGTKTKISTKNAIGNVVAMTDTPGGTINYTYFANGNLKTSNYGGVVTTIEQDGWGRKTKLIDPSAGTYLYEYNLFGETTKEVTPNGTTTYTLDNVGKLTTKTIVGNPTSLTNSSTVYAYDGTTKLLTSNTFTNTLEGGAVTTNTYEYDASKRLFKTTETTPYATFTKQLSFDAFGRTDKETSTAFLLVNGKASAKTIKNTYQNGYPWQILDDATSQVLWQTGTVNARGQLTTATLDNGIAITNAYDSYGFATQFKHDKAGTNIMTLNTVFDPQKGNLTSRTNSLFNWNESFLYDSLDRLTTYTNVQGQQEPQSYDDRGRITQNNVGTYNYTTSAKPYQNTSVTLTPAALTYYNTARQVQNITYNAFKSPVLIEEVGIDKISFTYNDGNDRSAMFYGSLDVDKLLRPNRKYYSGDGTMEIKYNKNTGATEFVTYIGGDGYSAPLIIKSDGTTQNYLYLHRDYQGSILAITSATGQIVEKRLFDAWGNIAKVQDGAGNTLNGLTILDRGYTGHEHLQSVGLINMNGRLYDPKLHRFLQPDNYIQEPFNSQNYNRYGYCWNNPLKYTDASGEWIWIVVGAIVGGVINWAAHGAQFNAQGLTAFGIGAAAGALAGIIGPAAFTAAGGGAAGAGGFLAGAAGGAVGAAASQTVLNVGNHIAFGDPLMSGKEFIAGIAFGAALGGAFNGVSALRNGRTFWTGTRITVQPMSLPTATGFVKTTGNAEIKTSDYKISSSTQPSTTQTTQANTATVINKETGFVDVSKNSAFRYMGEGELKAVQETGVLRGGNPGETFFTKDVYKSASLAQQRLALPTTPTLRVEFEILNNPSLQLNGSKVLPAFSMPGKGSEFMTMDPVKVRLINWQSLR